MVTWTVCSYSLIMELTVRNMFLLCNSGNNLYPHAVNIRDNAGDRPRDVAKRYAHLGCMALFTATDNNPLDNDSEDENIAQIIDTPTPQAIARASEKVEELQQLLKIAKTRYRQLGGELPEDREIDLIKADHSRYYSDYCILIAKTLVLLAQITIIMFGSKFFIFIVHGFFLKLAHFDPEANGYLSTPSESPLIELRNTCFTFEIGHSEIPLWVL